MTSQTIVEYFSNDSGYKCGYCGNEDTSLSNGMWAHRLTVQDYQDLIDRGWRRSGKYVYKPAMDKTCCPQYTIKCTVADFKLNKSHKKVIKRFNRYINTDQGKPEPGKPLTDSEQLAEGVDISDIPAERMSRDGQDDLATGDIDTSRLQPSPSEETAEAPTVKREVNCTERSPTSSSSSAGTDNSNRDEEAAAIPCRTSKKEPKPGLGADPNRPLCQKSKDRRRERWRQKHGADGEEPQAKTSKRSDAKTLEQLLKEIDNNAKHKFEVRLVRSSPRSEAFSATFDESYQVYKKYQMSVHGDPPEKPSERQYSKFLVESPLQVRLVRSSPQSEAFSNSLDESYEVYRRYQMAVHKDTPTDCDKRSYMSFLVHSPLQPYFREGGSSDGFGSFHQHYLIDGRIVAVGVIDILPTSVSSVYLYYDPDYFFLSPGTYSALQELAFTRQLGVSEPSIVSYYMGFYIHSCPKMRYKGQYIPSFLLCPETYNWIPIELCLPKLDTKKYSRLEESAEAKDVNGDVELGRILVLYERQALPYQFYSLINPEAEDEAEVLEYAALVGKVCAERILLVRS